MVIRKRQIKRKFFIAVTALFLILSFISFIFKNDIPREAYASHLPISFPCTAAFRTDNGTRYLTAQDGGGPNKTINADKDAIGPDEIFTLEDDGGGKIYIRTSGGYYAVAESGGGPPSEFPAFNARTFPPPPLGSWEEFVLETKGEPNLVAIRTTDNYYVVAEGGGGQATPDTTYVSGQGVNADRNSAGGWETFTLIPQSGCVPPPPPTANITCNNNPGDCTIFYNTSATLEWCGTSGSVCANAALCSVVPGGWFGTSGNVPTGKLTSRTTYTLTCTNSVGVSTQDSVTVDPPNDSRCISVVAPNIVLPPPYQTFSAQVTIQNTGTRTWKNDAQDPLEYHSMTTPPGPTYANPDFDDPVEPLIHFDGPGRDPILPISPVNTGEQVTFNYNNLITPTTPGTYPIRFQMIQQRVEWFGEVCEKNITVPIVHNFGLYRVQTTVSDVRLTEPNYCTSGPVGTVDWDYSISNPNPQDGYRVQVDNDPAFGSPEDDSCPSGLGCGGGTFTEYAIPTGKLAFNTVYYARVMVWNSTGAASGWTSMSACNGYPSSPGGCQPGNTRWRTPVHAWPDNRSALNYGPIWAPLNPGAGTPVQFSDRTNFAVGSSGQNWSWIFTGGNPASATGQVPPTVTYATTGLYNVAITSGDDVGSCTNNTTQINIQGAIPTWREIIPR